MSGDLITVGTVAAAVASALVAGIMFAFSTSVMPALGRRPAPEGIAAMQAMNSAILDPAFGLVFGGAALLCAVLAVTAPFTVDESHALLRALGAALYLVGTFGVTIAINVPMNVQLESADAGSRRVARSGTGTSADGRRGTPFARSSGPPPRRCW